MTKTTLFFQSIAIAATLYASFAHAEGKVIARKDLPAAVQATEKKAPKFPGIPACAKGRLVTDWGTVMDLDDAMTAEKVQSHKCAESKTVYACAAFGKLSVRCE